MRVAALYDIHGNLAALESVLADPRCASADAILVGGDVVAGPHPRETLERLLGLGGRARFVRGNGDRWVSGDAEPDLPAGLALEVRWCAARLDPEQRALVRAWPTSVVLQVDGIGATLFCHATPTSDMPLLTPLTPEHVVADALGPVEENAVVCGHIHVQYDRRVGERRLINAGSVGRPYEGRRGAFWGLLGGDVQLVHTEYDVEAAVAAMRAAGYPGEEFLTQLLEPVTADEAVANFERLRGA